MPKMKILGGFTLMCNNLFGGNSCSTLACLLLIMCMCGCGNNNCNCSNCNNCGTC